MSGRINNNLKEQIADANDIVEVINEYIPLKKSGKNFKACCPFHNEKTPSFFVSQEKQFYHCFGCKASGDVFSFVMKYEEMDFFSALTKLAERVNISITYSHSSESEGQKDRLYKVNEDVCKYYFKILEDKLSGRIRQYLSDRGIDVKPQRNFKLGYAPDSWDALQRWAKTRAIDAEDLLSLGLIIKREGKSGYYDRFRKRIMIPIFSVTGRVTGFGGRVIDNSAVKYMNSPESPLFNKGNILYGLNYSRDDVSKNDCAIVVEGYFDFLALYSAGVKNVVASLGTSFTESHVNLIKRYTDNVVMAYDSDTAGQKASLRALEIFLSNDMYVKVLVLPRGEDPDSFLRKKGIDALKKEIDNAVDIMDFQFSLLAEEHDISTDGGRVKIAGSIIETINKIPSSIRRDIYLKRFSEKLGVDERMFREELGRKVVPSIKRKEEKNVSKVPRVSAKDLLLKLSLEDLQCAKLLIDNNLGVLFQDREQLLLAKYIVKYAEGGKRFSPVLLAGAERDSIVSYAASVSMQQSHPEMDKVKAANDCIRKIENNLLNEKIKKIENEIKLAEKDGNFHKVPDLLKEIQGLKKSSPGCER